MLISIVASFALFGGNFGQELPKKDFQLPVGSVKSFFKVAESELGIRVFVDQSVESRLIYIRVKNRTIREVITMVASAADLQVVEGNGAMNVSAKRVRSGLELDFTNWKSDLEDISPHSIEEQQIRGNLTKYIEDVRSVWIDEGKTIPRDFWKRFEGYKRIDPAKWAVRKVIESLGQKELDWLPEGYRTVFSTHPTSMQEKWPGRGDLLLKEINDLAEIRNAVVTELFQDSQPGVHAFKGGFKDSWGGADAPIAKLLLVSKRSGGEVTHVLKGFDADGNSLFSERTIFPRLFEDPEVMSRPIGEIFKSLTEVWEMNEEEKEEYRRLQLIGWPNPNTPVPTPDDLAWLGTIDEQEPNAGLVSRLFDWAVDGSRKELVTEVDIPAFYDGRQGSWTQQKAAWMAFNSSWRGSRIEPSESLIVQRLFGPEMRNMIFPRKAGAALARKRLTEGRITLEDLIMAINTLDDKSRGANFIRQILMMSGQSIGTDIYSEGEWPYFVLELLRELSPLARGELASIGQLKIDLDQAPVGLRSLLIEKVQRDEMIFSASGSEAGGGAKSQSSRWPDTVPNTDWNREQSVLLSLREAMPVGITFEVMGDKGLMVSAPGSRFIVGSEFRTYDALGGTMAAEEFAIEKRVVDSSVSSYLVSACQLITVRATLRFGAFPEQILEFQMLESPRDDMQPFEGIGDDIRRTVLDSKVKHLKELRGG